MLLVAESEIQVTCGSLLCLQPHAVLPVEAMVASWMMVQPHAAMPERAMVAVQSSLLPPLAAGPAGHGEQVEHNLLVKMVHHHAARVSEMHVTTLVQSSEAFAAKPHSRVLIAPASLG